jgi:hypothetical protein
MPSPLFRLNNDRRRLTLDPRIAAAHNSRTEALKPLRSGRDMPKLLDRMIV